MILLTIIVSFLLIVIMRQIKTECYAFIWLNFGDFLVTREYRKQYIRMKTTHFQGIDFPESLIVLIVNEGRIFVTWRSAAIALLILHF